MTDTIYVLQYFNDGEWIVESYTRSLKEAEEWRIVDVENRGYAAINEYVPDSPTEED